jgi:hypothetical protein
MDRQEQGPLDPATFRAELDGVLRRRDPAALRAFLVERGQWTPATTTDPEAAMWMMIAASPALTDLRGAAETWLRSHGHAAEAEAILGRGRSAGARKGPTSGTGARGDVSDARRGRHSSATRRPPSSLRHPRAGDR